MKPIRQEIVNVNGSTVQVKSSKGNIYPIVISDFVRIKKPALVKAGNIGIVNKTPNGNWYLIDVEKKHDESDSYLAEVPIDDLMGEY